MKQHILTSIYELVVIEQGHCYKCSGL